MSAAFWYRLTWVVLDNGPLNKCVCGGTYTLFYFFTTKNCECSYVVFEQQDGRCDAMRASVLCGVGIAMAPTTEHLPVHGYQLRDDVTAQLLPLTTVAWRRRQQTEKFDANGSVVTTRAATEIVSAPS